MLPTLVLTRPKSEAQIFLAQVTTFLRAEPPCVIAPVIEIRVEDAVLPVFERAVLTSVQAVKVLGARLAGTRVWCVGGQTAKLAESFGARVEMVSETADGLVRGAGDLAGAIYFRGAHVSRDLAHDLGIGEVVLYHQEARALSGEARAVLTSGRAVVLPVFSRRSGAILAAQVENYPPHVHIIAMSAATAAEFPRAAHVSVVAAPNAGEMVKAVVAALKEQA